MKKIYIIMLLFLTCGIVACYEDNSSLGMVEIGDIEIEELKDISIVSYSGHVLHVEPEIKAGYSEEEMRYAWYIHGGIFDDGSSVEGGYRANLISEEKILNYEMNLPSGIYRLIFEAIASNGYSQRVQMNVTVSTPFSQGFYLLKETADGNTEVDLLMPDGLNENLMEKALGTPLSGKPIGMSIIYKNGYINEETLEMDDANMLHVMTESDYRGFRTEDLLQVVNLNNLTYDGALPSGEHPLTMVQYSNGIVMMTEAGIYTTNDACWGATSSKFGVNLYSAGSKHVFAMGGGMDGLLFWGEYTHRIYDKLGLTSSEPLDWELPEGVEAENLTCLASSVNTHAGEDIGWFLLEDKVSSKRYLAIIALDDSGFYAVSYIKEVREVTAGSHLAEGTLFAGLGLQGRIIYVVDDNMLYAYDFINDTETHIPLPGLEKGTIIYIGNNYMNANFGDDSDNEGDFLFYGVRGSQRPRC